MIRPGTYGQEQVLRSTSPYSQLEIRGKNSFRRVNELPIDTYEVKNTIFFLVFSIITLPCSAQVIPFAFLKKPTLTCPAGYVKVPKNTSYTSADFCVMQYEAKAETNAGGTFDADGLSVTLGSYKPSSVSNDQPWRSINRNDARTECQSLGSGYDLISNAQWQTIARNLELEGANWTTGVVGGAGSCMFQGNNGEGTCGYNGSNPVTSSSNARGIFTLSNSNTIYDFAGNVWEWVKDNNATNYGSDAYSSTITDVTHTVSGTLDDAVSRKAKAQFSPSGSYSTANNNSGLGHGWLNYSSGAALRGGGWTDTDYAGVFSVNLNGFPGGSNTDLGFRCVYSP